MLRPKSLFSFWCICSSMAAISCGPDPPDDGSLAIQTRITASPAGTLEDIETLLLASRRIEVVHRSVVDDPDTERIVVVTREPGSIGIRLLKNDTAQIALLPVPPGFVSQVRFIARVEADRSGRRVDVKLPSGEQSGLKLVAPEGAPFEIRNEADAFLITRQC